MPSADGRRDIGVVEDHVGRLAAEFQRRRVFTISEASCITRLPARVDPVKETMSVFGCDTIASPTTGPKPGDEVEDALGQSHFVDDVGEDEGVDRRHLARLQHDGATGGQ